VKPGHQKMVIYRVKPGLLVQIFYVDITCIFVKLHLLPSNDLNRQLDDEHTFPLLG